MASTSSWSSTPHISPSLLAADFSCLGDEIRSVEAAGADSIHLDIMDGDFVPNISYGPAVIKALRQQTSLFYDVHLMLQRPAEYVDAFLDAGAQNISFHVEADVDISATLRQIREGGSKAGLVVKPDTAVDVLYPYLEEVDMLLVMTVNPGFGGQSFMDECLSKVTDLRAKLGPAFPIQIDGGVGLETIGAAAKAGANVFVAGTSVFGEKNRAAAIDGLRREYNAALEK